VRSVGSLGEGVILPDYRLDHSISNLIKWPIKTILNIIRVRMRFVLLSPNFVRTQVIYDRIVRKVFTIKIRDGIDYLVVRQVYEAEDYCLQRLERYQDLVMSYRAICANNRVPLILDLGAHAGLASKYFAREFPEAKIIAVEPDAGNLAAARVNLRGEANVVLMHRAVSCKSGKGRLMSSDLGSWGYRTEHYEKGSLELISVNSILEDEAACRCTPFIVKIDIEGFEQDLFMSNTEWVERFPLLIIELHDWMFPREGKSRNFLGCIATLDRDFIYINENIFSIRNNVGGCG
jgi:FkbM family methyltransferase